MQGYKRLFTLLGQQIMSKTQDFSINEMMRQSQMYLYLILQHFQNLSTEQYFIRMTEESLNGFDIIFEEMIDLDHYIQEHKIEAKQLWTQISPMTQTNIFQFAIKKRVLMKKTKFELDEVMNSQEVEQENDRVEGLVYSPQRVKKSKFGIDKRKSKSFQSSVNNFSPVPFCRLDTITEEESNLMNTERKDKDFNDFCSIQKLNGQRRMAQRFSQGIKTDRNNFEIDLKRHSTWIQRSGNDEGIDQFVSAFQPSLSNGNIENSRPKIKISENSRKPQTKKSFQGDFQKQFAVNSKLTKASEDQYDENEISFLDKSSLLIDLEKSQLNITPDQKMSFKLKWILLVFVVLGMAIFSSLSTDAFDLNKGQNKKYKKSKKDKNNNNHGTDKKLNIKDKKKAQNKPKKLIHA